VKVTQLCADYPETGRDEFYWHNFSAKHSVATNGFVFSGSSPIKSDRVEFGLICPTSSVEIVHILSRVALLFHLKAVLAFLGALPLQIP
jgi:hypothetical protein